MSSDSEDEERSCSKSPQNEENVTEQNAVDGNKTLVGQRRRNRVMRSSSDSQKPVVDVNSSIAEVEEVSQTYSSNGTPRGRRKKSKMLPESEELEEKVRTPMFTDPALPFGWHRECVQRKTGKTEGHYDVYLFSPAGKKFRSRVELAKFLAATNSDLDPEEFDFSVYGRKGYGSNSATKKKIKAILKMNSSSPVLAPEKKETEIKSETPKPDKPSDSRETKRTYVKRGRKPKDKAVSPQPQKKARLKFTPTIKEIIKSASKTSYCLDCGKEGCKYPYVVLEHAPRRLDLLVREGIKYR